MQQRRFAAAPTGGQRDQRVRRGAEYDAYYRALELPPGASLADIEDRAALLREAFQPDELPDNLKEAVADRADIVEFAATELRYYWRTYGKAPPSADLAGADGLLDALVEALGDSFAGSGADVAAAATSPAPAPSRSVVIRPASARPAARRFGPAAPYRAPAGRPVIDHLTASADGTDPRVQRIEIALELVHRHVIDLGGRAYPAALRPPTPPLLPYGRPAEPLIAARPAPAIPVLPPPATARRRPLPAAGSALLKVGVVGLAIGVAALWIQHYGLDRGSPDPAGAVAAAVTTPPPVQTGLMTATRRPTGVFARPDAAR